MGWTARTGFALVAAMGAALAFVATGCDGRPRDAATDGESMATVSEDHVAELDLRGGAPEESSGSLFAPARPKTFSDLIGRLRGMPDEPHLKGVLVRLGTSMGLARAEEVGRHLGALRDRGLPIVCHAHGYGNSTMLVAARGCDEIFLSPAGTVDTIGIAGQLIFGRGLLDRLHVEVDFLQVGKFKGAKEPFTNTTASPEARQSLQTALSGMREGWLEGFQLGRGKSGAALGVEDGPHSAEAAKKLGLIDELGFYEDAKRRALERAGVEGRVPYFGGDVQRGDGLAELVRVLSGASGATVPHVAVVRASGGITMQGGGGLFQSGGITEAGLSQVVRRLQRSESTKAVVLRIDSPGGSALASDLLWRALMDLRADKPLVVSVGSMAASGGYYLACAANKIVAERTSIIGSIGVVAGKLSFSESLREIGVNVEAVPAAPLADPSRALLASPFSGWDEATREKLQTTIQSMYDLFLARIAEGRGVEVSVIAPAAEGRLMGGLDAQKAGLVDEVGGLSRAIELALELAELDPKTPIDIVETDQGLLDALGLSSAEARADAIRELERRTAQEATNLLLGGLSPFQDEIGAFGASVSPLLTGERLIVALPFVLAIR